MTSDRLAQVGLFLLAFFLGCVLSVLPIRLQPQLGWMLPETLAVGFMLGSFGPFVMMQIVLFSRTDGWALRTDAILPAMLGSLFALFAYGTMFP